MDGAASGSAKPARLLAAHPDLVDRLYSEVSASPWSVSRQRFEDALERSAAKRFASSAQTEQVTRPKLEEFLGALHLQDLSLAAACASGQPAAWEFFVITYRGYLRASAAAILRCKSDSVAAQDLADSLFTDLYGISASSSGKSEDRSLFRYFHGRSSLKTWLRAVLAQRHIDSMRASRRFVEIDDQSTSSAVRRRSSISGTRHSASTPLPTSPIPRTTPRPIRIALATSHCSPTRSTELSTRSIRATASASASTTPTSKPSPHIGRELGEHESSVSRNLDRIRRELRAVGRGRFALRPISVPKWNVSPTGADATSKSRSASSTPPKTLRSISIRFSPRSRLSPKGKTHDGSTRSPTAPPQGTLPRHEAVAVPAAASPTPPVVLIQESPMPRNDREQNFEKALARQPSFVQRCSGKRLPRRRNPRRLSRSPARSRRNGAAQSSHRLLRTLPGNPRPARSHRRHRRRSRPRPHARSDRPRTS